MTPKMELVCIQVCETMAEAQVVKGLLEVNGIHAALIARDAFVVGTGGNVKVMVSEADAQEALDLLGESAQPQTLAQLSGFVVGELAGGTSQEAIVQQLVDDGWADEPARQFVQDQARRMSVRPGPEQDSAAAVEAYRRRMVRGLLWTAGGIALTVATSKLAGSTGGLYIVFWGAIIYGLVDFATGLAGWLRHR